MYAKMARFYGFGHEELMRMKVNWFNDYYKAITVLEAQEELIGMQRETYPHMKNSKRKELHKKYSKLAYQYQEKKFVSPKELFERLKNG